MTDGVEPAESLVTVYVITFRRPLLLRRALKSVLNQSHKLLRVLIINDDPDDVAPKEILSELGDTRLELYEPTRRRGGAENLNIAFAGSGSPFSAILEDDNWWEETFLSTMLNALRDHPASEVAVGNERLWKEEVDGSWTDKQQTVWPDVHGVALLDANPINKCGGSALCNSTTAWTGSLDWAA